MAHTPLRPAEIVVIGISTGGPDALAEVLAKLPADLAAPVLAVQHVPPSFTGDLASRLDKICALRVRKGEHGALLIPGDVWLAPTDLHMVVRADPEGPRLGVHRGPLVQFCRPAVDPLFRSASEVYGAGVLAVVLTGLGQDGVNGSRFVRSRGGQVLVQDEASSAIWGMPGAVVRAGMAHCEVPLDAMGATIAARSQRQRAA